MFANSCRYNSWGIGANSPTKAVNIPKHSSQNSRQQIRFRFAMFRRIPEVKVEKCRKYRNGKRNWTCPEILNATACESYGPFFGTNCWIPTLRFHLLLPGWIAAPCFGEICVSNSPLGSPSNIECRNHPSSGVLFPLGTGAAA